MPNQEPASALIFGNSKVRVGTQGLFRPYLKTFVPPFLPTWLTALESLRMRPAERDVVGSNPSLLFEMSRGSFPGDVMGGLQ